MVTCWCLIGELGVGYFFDSAVRHRYLARQEGQPDAPRTPPSQDQTDELLHPLTLRFYDAAMEETFRQQCFRESFALSVAFYLLVSQPLLNMPSALPVGSAPPASLGHPKARCAPAHPGAPPPQRGGSRWPPEPARASSRGSCTTGFARDDGLGPVAPPPRTAHDAAPPPHRIAQHARPAEGAPPQLAPPRRLRRRRRLDPPSTLSEDGGPSACRVPPGAQAAPSHPKSAAGAAVGLAGASAARLHPPQG